MINLPFSTTKKTTTDHWSQSGCSILYWAWLQLPYFYTWWFMYRASCIPFFLFLNMDLIDSRIFQISKIVRKSKIPYELIKIVGGNWILYYFNQMFTSCVISNIFLFFLFALNQKKKFRPSWREKSWTFGRNNTAYCTFFIYGWCSWLQLFTYLTW